MSKGFQGLLESFKLLEQEIVAMGDVVPLVVVPIHRVVERAKDTYNSSAVRDKLAPPCGPVP